jgi:predicted dienelactone hydrolase
MRRRLLRPAACIAFAGIAAACTTSSSTSGATRTSTATTTTVPARAYGVATRQEIFVDPSRPTPRNGTYLGAPTRTLRTVFYFPTEHGAPARTGAPFPVVVFSHGNDGLPDHYPLLSDLARAGYVVVAPAYPLSNHNAPGGAVPVDLLQQPKDASFVLDRVLREAASGTSWLSGFIDPTRIAAAGHSLGAMTTYALVYNTCCRDRRFRAAVVMSGVLGPFPGQWFTGIDTPLLATHGDHDGTIPYSSGLRAWQQAHAPKWFLTIVNGGHSSEEKGGSSLKQQALTRAIVDFLDAQLRGDTGALSALRARPGLTQLQVGR